MARVRKIYSTADDAHQSCVRGTSTGKTRTCFPFVQWQWRGTVPTLCRYVLGATHVLPKSQASAPPLHYYQRPVCYPVEGASEFANQRDGGCSGSHALATTLVIRRFFEPLFRSRTTRCLPIAGDRRRSYRLALPHRPLHPPPPHWPPCHATFTSKAAGHRNPDSPLS